VKRVKWTSDEQFTHWQELMEEKQGDCFDKRQMQGGVSGGDDAE
jgi:hypothetical protein